LKHGWQDSQQTISRSAQELRNKDETLVLTSEEKPNTHTTPPPQRRKSFTEAIRYAITGRTSPILKEDMDHDYEDLNHGNNSQ
jgi:hypothetical protein